MNDKFCTHGHEVDTCLDCLCREARALRARLGEAERQRDEAWEVMLESNANALRARHDATAGDERWAREQARIAKQRDDAHARADRAEAACAEMRAALEMSNNAHQATLYDEDFDRDDEREAQRIVEATHALLSRTDLGAGMVLVPREMVERARRILLDDDYRAVEGIVADLDALLVDKKGGG